MVQPHAQEDTEAGQGAQKRWEGSCIPVHTFLRKYHWALKRTDTYDSPVIHTAPVLPASPTSSMAPVALEKTCLSQLSGDFWLKAMVVCPFSHRLFLLPSDTSIASQENVAKVGSSLPMPPEEPQEPMAVEKDDMAMEKDDMAMHDSASPFLGLTSCSGIRFVVTPPPKDWAVDCRELDAARKAVKAFLCDTFST